MSSSERRTRIRFTRKRSDASDPSGSAPRDLRRPCREEGGAAEGLSRWVRSRTHNLCVDSCRLDAHVDGHRCTLVSRRGHVFSQWAVLCSEISHKIRASAWNHVRHSSFVKNGATSPDHPNLEKEDRVFGRWSGDWVCTQCSATGPRKYLEKTPEMLAPV